MALRPPVLRFGLWYALNVAYNITNKLALEHVRIFVEGATSTSTSTSVIKQASSSSLPFTIGCLQFGVGAIYSIILWLSGCRRPVPHAAEISSAISRCTERAKVRDFNQNSSRIGRLVGRHPNDYTPLSTKSRKGSDHQHADDDGEHATVTENHDTNSATSHHTSSSSSSSAISFRHTFHIAIHHTLGQICTVICLSYNSIGFAHVIKAMEPLFSALASFIILGQIMDIRVYASLIPVVGGVVLACAGSNEFVWISFWSGMGSNAFFAVRGVISKIAMEAGEETRSRHHQEHHESTSPKYDEIIELTTMKNDGKIWRQRYHNNHFGQCY